MLSGQFLKSNAEDLRKAIDEVFKGSEDIELRGQLIHFDYTENDCSDFQFLGSRNIPQEKGPGIRIAVKFNNALVKRFYYSENECHCIEEFLDNLNTDFGMAQMMDGRKTSNLGIHYYDLKTNMIEIFLTRNRVGGEPITVKKYLLKDCWDVSTLVFNIKTFELIKASAENDAGLKKFTPRSTTKDSTLPDTIKLLGINKKDFLHDKKLQF